MAACFGAERCHVEARGGHLVERLVLVAVDRLDLVGAVPPEGGAMADELVAELVRALLMYAEVGVLEAENVEVEALMALHDSIGEQLAWDRLPATIRDHRAAAEGAGLGAAIARVVAEAAERRAGLHIPRVSVFVAQLPAARVVLELDILLKVEQVPRDVRDLVEADDRTVLGVYRAAVSSFDDKTRDAL